MRVPNFPTDPRRLRYHASKTEVMIRIGHTDQCDALREEIDRYGFCLVSQLVSPAQMRTLIAEALNLFEQSEHCVADTGLEHNVFVTALGPQALHYLSEGPVLYALNDLFGRPYRLCKEASGYLYYLDDGFLDPHLDEIPGEHPVATVSYLYSEVCEQSIAPELHVYSNGPSPNQTPTRTFATQPGSVLIGRGTEYWHGRGSGSTKPGKMIAITGSFCSAPSF